MFGNGTESVALPTFWQVATPFPLIERMLDPTGQPFVMRGCTVEKSTAMVPLVVIGPPSRPVPVAMLVTVPPDGVGSVTQTHALPLYCNT